jgi:hypothetical protein
MPVPAGTFSTGRAVGNREDLQDKIYRITPTDTPFQMLCGTTQAKGVLHEWQTDALAAQDNDNAVLEGDTPAITLMAPTARVQNYCQISRKTGGVSGTQEAVDKAGRDSDLNLFKAKAGLELRIDMEGILSGRQPQNAGAVDANGIQTTARRTRGFEHFVTSNVSYGTNGANGANATTALTDGTQRAFSETEFLNVLQACYVSGGKPTDALLGPYAKRLASGFTGRSQARVQVSDETVQQSASVYASDFGDIRLHPSLYTRARTALIVDKRYLKIAFLRRMKTKDLPSSGDNESFMMVTEYALHMGNQASCGKVADLTTAP